MISIKQLKDLQTKSAQFVLSAGQEALDSWQSIKTVSYKDSRDVVTDVDVRLEKQLRDNLHVLFPEAGFIVEEGDSEKSDEYNWTIDPIDQTKSYATRFPVFYIQIALLYRDEPMLGHIYNPVSKQLFSASKGNGAVLNNKALKVSDDKTLDKSILDIDLGGSDEFTTYNMAIIQKLVERAYRVRISGGAFPIYLLNGTIEGYVVLNSTTKIVDQAPRIIIMREAGYRAEYIPMQNRQILIAAPDKLFAIIKSTIND